MSATKRVLVTGATGFVGSAVIRALVGTGRRIRALVRPGSPRENLAGLEIELSEGDLRDPASVDRAMAGSELLFHVAADYRLWALDPAEIVRNNLDGTRNVMEAALRHGVERIVYTSSVATLAPRPDGSPADESDPLDAANAIGAYKQSKVAAERLVQAMVAFLLGHTVTLLLAVKPRWRGRSCRLRLRINHRQDASTAAAFSPPSKGLSS